MSICEENCDFTEYDFKAKKAICTCFVKVNLPLIDDIKFDKDKLVANFKDIRNIGNFHVLSCLKEFLHDRKIFKNLTYYMLIIILIISFISIFIFLHFDYKKIKNFIFNNDKKKSENEKNENIMTTNNEKNEKNEKKQIKIVNKNLMNFIDILDNNKIKIKLKKKLKELKLKKKLKMKLKALIKQI